VSNFLKLFGRPAEESETPLLGGPEVPLSAAEKQKVRAPIVAGGLVIGVFVLGLTLWASVSSISGGVVAPGQVRVESNRKSLKSRDPGVVRGIYVRDGDKVVANQVLLKFDDTVAKAQVAILEAQYMAGLAQRVRSEAESTGRKSFVFPAELRDRAATDLSVVTLMRNEEFLFRSRLDALQGQADILQQRIVQLRERQSGIQVQIDSIDEQARLSREELQGYQTLYEKGYAPKTLLLRLQRAIAQAGGQRGALLSDKTRTQEQIGETQLQLNSLYQERSSEAAENKRKADAVLADVGPRLGAAREALAATVVRAPVDGIVLNLTQHTLGGVAGAGELLLDVVPANAPLVVLAMIKPADIDEVRVGMKAQVDLAAYNAMKVPKVDATVLNVSADSLSNDKTGESYFVAELKIDPTDFRRMPKGVRLYPGMPANVMIITGKRTVMSYLLGPIGDIFDHALRES